MITTTTPTTPLDTFTLELPKSDAALLKTYLMAYKISTTKQINRNLDSK